MILYFVYDLEEGGVKRKSKEKEKGLFWIGLVWFYKLNVVSSQNVQNYKIWSQTQHQTTKHTIFLNSLIINK